MKFDELKTAMYESSGKYADPVVSEMNDKDGFWNTPELECSMVVDDIDGGNENEILRKSIPPCHIPSEFSEKDTDIYTDKNVMDCGLPELLICYKESVYQDVKDICIDEGIPVGVSYMDDNGKDNREICFTSVLDNGNHHGDVIKGSLDTDFIQDWTRSSSGKNCSCHAAIECYHEEKMVVNWHSPNGNSDLCASLPTDLSDMSKVSADTDFPVQDGLKLSSEKDCKGNAAKECVTKENGDIDLPISDEPKKVSENGIDEHTASECGPDGLNLSVETNIDQQAANNFCREDPPEKRTDEDLSNSNDNITDDAPTDKLVSSSMLSEQQSLPQTSLKFLLESSGPGVDDAEQQPGQIPVEEISKSPIVASSAQELNRTEQTTNVSYDSKVESGTITFNFDSGKAAASATDGSSENDRDLPLQLRHVLSHEDRTSDNLSMSAQLQRGEGESSFSVAGPVSGLITYSGPIAFSGSISLRSDSSTTSTRSFAFPVLQSEWNSSPVRMANADRRRFGKHRGWRQSLLCCRF